jgi:two-component system OmpR family sensor kinase
MRLSTRLSLFFLASLSVVLAGFSVMLYLLASKYLYRQLDERLEAAVNTLIAAAEIGPGGVEWEPHERSLSFGRRTLEGQLAWQVCDAKGRPLDGSSTAAAASVLARQISEPFRAARPGTLRDREGVTWRVMHRQLGPASASTGQTRKSEPAPGLHSALVVVAAVSTEGVTITLRNLALVLTGLALGAGVVAVLGCNRLSRRALRPVTAMAKAAHAIEAVDLGERLPVPRTGDELEELGTSFNALLDRLQESLERQARFAGDASHQLRTPLTAIQGQVDLALRQDRDADEYRRVLALVQRRTGHLRQIVESLLFLARADQAQLAPDLQSIDMEEWLGEHARSWHDTARRQDLRLEVAGGGPYCVRADPALLSELIDNLLDNAGRYSQPGTPIRLTLGFDQDRSHVMIGVEDEGIGIAPEELPHVFEPFYRAADIRLGGSSGLGLGLAIAQRLAASFGGKIGVLTHRPRGTRFTVLLPAAPENLRLRSLIGAQTVHRGTPDPS